MTQKKYRAFQMRMFVGIFVWAGVLAFGMYFWNELKWYFKALVFIIAFLLVPSLEDIKDSFKSYDQYKKEWEEANKTEEQQ